MSNSSNQSSSIGFCSIFTILFIALKFTDCITWSWFWVLSPLWIPPLIMAGTIITALGVIGIVFLILAAIIAYEGRGK